MLFMELQTGALASSFSTASSRHAGNNVPLHFNVWKLATVSPLFLLATGALVFKKQDGKTFKKQTQENQGIPWEDATFDGAKEAGCIARCKIPADARGKNVGSCNSHVKSERELALEFVKLKTEIICRSLEAAKESCKFWSLKCILHYLRHRTNFLIYIYIYIIGIPTSKNVFLVFFIKKNKLSMTQHDNLPQGTVQRQTALRKLIDFSHGKHGLVYNSYKDISTRFESGEFFKMCLPGKPEDLKNSYY